MILNMIDPVSKITSNGYFKEAFHGSIIYTFNAAGSKGKHESNNMSEKEDIFHKDLSDVSEIDWIDTRSMVNSIWNRLIDYHD